MSVTSSAALTAITVMLTVLLVTSTSLPAPPADTELSVKPGAGSILGHAAEKERREQELADLGQRQRMASEMEQAQSGVDQLERDTGNPARHLPPHLPRYCSEARRAALVFTPKRGNAICGVPQG